MCTGVGHSNYTRLGFTLVELLFASMIMSIVMLGVGSLFVSYWRIHSKFVNEESTMQEISMLSTIFTESARGSGKQTPNSQGIVFLKDGIESAISYNSANHSVVYDPDLSVDGNSVEMLSHSVVADFSASITVTILSNGYSVVQMDIDLVELELNKTNRYRFAAMSRNES